MSTPEEFGKDDLNSVEKEKISVDLPPAGEYLSVNSDGTVMPFKSKKELIDYLSEGHS